MLLTETNSCISLAVSLKCNAKSLAGGSVQGPVSRKSRKLVGPEKSFVNLPTACSGKLIFKHVFKVTKSKLTVKFDELNPLCS